MFIPFLANSNISDCCIKLVSLLLIRQAWPSHYFLIYYYNYVVIVVVIIIIIIIFTIVNKIEGHHGATINKNGRGRVISSIASHAFETSTAISKLHFNFNSRYNVTSTMTFDFSDDAGYHGDSGDSNYDDDDI